jgi:transposase-like protein
MAAGKYDESLKEQARDMRRAGMSVSRIAHELGVHSTSVVQRWVADLPPPPWTRRPNAKDDDRLRARELRLEGGSLKEIARELEVAPSTVSVWVRDLPVPPGLRERAAHAHRINGQRWLRERARREDERRRVKQAARDRVGFVSERELMLVGAILYWAEGAKDKPYDRREHVALINSDVQVIRLFQRWLDLMGVPEEDRRYRLSIHESADVGAAQDFWSEVTGVPVSRFARPTLKRHEPKTIRRNVGDGYRGCLVISVCKSRVLYQQIEGLFTGLAEAVDDLGTSRDADRTWPGH